MATRGAFLRSRVGRRLFGVFVTTALVPVVALAVVSYLQVSSELHTQSGARLYSAARGTGHELARRLLELERRLVEGNESRGFVAVGTGEESAFDGLDTRPVDSDTRLVATPGSALLIVPTARGTRVGLADPGELFALTHENVLPTGGEFVVATEGRIIASSLPDAFDAGFAPHPAWLGNDRADELLDWDHHGTRYLSRQWPLFLDASLGAPAWNVAILEPRSQVLAPLRMFSLAFAATILVIVFLVPLLAAGQIRRSLVPLERLQQAAARIGGRDFEARVRVESDDEFGEVGRSFNQMADALSDHFGALDRMLDIDREILAATDEAAVVAALVDRVPALADCRVARFAPVAPPDGSGDAQRAGRISADAHASLDLAPGLPSAPGPHAREVLGALLPEPADAARLIAMEAGGGPLGVLILGGLGDDPSRLSYACQLADQASAALGQLREREQRRILASYDPVTQLPNLRSFEERLAHELGSDAGGVAIWAARVDGLARVSRSYGRALEEEVLRSLARRLHAIEGGTEVFRIGEDTLAGMATGLEQARARARRVAREIGCPVGTSAGDADAAEVHLRGFVGVAQAPGGESAVALIQSARSAADEALAQGHAAVRVATRDDDERAREMLRVEAALHRALERDELRLEYQPIFDTRTGDLIAAEALMRWSPAEGPISPAVFIPLAEESGLIVDLGRWGLREATTQLETWIGEGLDPIQMHVNVSSRQLDAGPSLHQLTRDALLASGLPARLLVLELTESVLTDATEQNVKALESVVKLGASLAVDDFGTGYASLAYLQKFPFASLKIDQAFVRDLPENTGNAEIVRAVIGMADGLGLTVVAEGVETEDALAFLKDAGCGEVQGYLFSKPLPVDAFRKLYAEYCARGAVAQ